MKNVTYGRLERFVEFCIRRRVAVVIVLGIITAIMTYLAVHVEIKTVFNDLMPRNHSYVAVHNKFKQTFGGSNMVSIMLEVEQGDVFNSKVLGKVKKVTTDLQMVEGVNPFQIISLASKKLREVRASTSGIDTRPLMWPNLPNGEAELAALRKSVLNNSMTYGAYVSTDLKATLITADFYDHLIDYGKIFQQVQKIANSVEGDGVKVRVVGEPILYGWVNYYLPETIQIFLTTIALMVGLLFLLARTWRGTLLPLLAGVISATWALGSAKLLNYHLDPLVIVVAFLITARAISHSVQLVTRFDEEVAVAGVSTGTAAKAAMLSLFKPGMLGVVADAGCMIVVILTPIPLLEKVAVIGTIWVATIAVSACVLTPVLLSWTKRPDGYAHPIDVSPLMNKILRGCIHVVTSRLRYVVLGGAALVFVVSAFYAFRLTVGDANPGSPILWQNSAYNQDASSINTKFQGSDRMFVAIAGDKPDAMKQPAVLESMQTFQKFMEAQPEVGGSYSLADIIPLVKQSVREDNPRYSEFGNDANENGELMYMYVSGTDPGDMARFADNTYTNAAVTLYFRDHKGETIRTAVARVKEFISNHPLENAHYELAGGLIGVLAAINEVILAGQIESIALALLVLVACCAVAYRSTTAGMFFMVPVMLSNTLTFSYMALMDIGMNINTLPVAALGIGLGVDYAFYIVDGVKEELHKNDNLVAAISKSLMGAGKGVLVTGSTLIVAVVLWTMSSLRFQADMALLMSLWLFVSAASALLIMPAMIYVFKPAFIVGHRVRQAKPVLVAA
jgi:predicted RND superfamily exporter protein